jgi:hypothetical protein
MTFRTAQTAPLADISLLCKQIFLAARVLFANKKAASTLRCLPPPFLTARRLCLAVAAAAENDNQRQNENPGAVIVKKIAQAVVIHSILL